MTTTSRLAYGVFFLLLAAVLWLPDAVATIGLTVVNVVAGCYLLWTWRKARRRAS